MLSSGNPGLSVKITSFEDKQQVRERFSETLGHVGLAFKYF